MEKLELVQRVLRFSTRIREWCEKKHSIFFDDFDNENVNDYEENGLGPLADAIIEEGLEESIIDNEDLS